MVAVAEFSFVHVVTPPPVTLLTVAVLSQYWIDSRKKSPIACGVTVTEQVVEEDACCWITVPTPAKLAITKP
jgi:hypothetical protein